MVFSLQSPLQLFTNGALHVLFCRDGFGYFYDVAEGLDVGTHADVGAFFMGERGYGVDHVFFRKLLVLSSRLCINTIVIAA